MFTRRVGRNEAYNHAATWSPRSSRYSWLPDRSERGSLDRCGLAIACIFATYAVNANAIDHDVARGADDGINRRTSQAV